MAISRIHFRENPASFPDSARIGNWPGHSAYLKMHLSYSCDEACSNSYCPARSGCERGMTIKEIELCRAH